MSFKYEGYNELHVAVHEENNDEVKRLLLQKKIGVNSKTPDGETALHIAAQLGHTKLLGSLIEHGGDVRFLAVFNGCSAWCALGTAKTVTRVP